MDGFLPFSRASFMTDVVAVGLAVILPLVVFGWYLAHSRGNYQLHKRLQTSLTIALGTIVLLFELDVRFFDWHDRAAPSPYYDTWLFPLLYVHLVIATSTALLWTFAVTHAYMNIPKPARPSRASYWHKRLGTAAGVGMFGTAFTGWAFFWAAYVAH